MLFEKFNLDNWCDVRLRAGTIKENRNDFNGNHNNVYI